MNPWQMAQQIKHELEQVTWAGGSTEVVFGAQGAVRIFAGTPTEEQIPAGFPWALVGIGTGTPDPEHPEFLVQGFQVISAVNVAGDPLGEFAVIGAGTSDLGKSASRGIGEIAERVRSQIQNLTGFDGARVLLSSVNTGAPQTLGRGRHIVFDDLGLSALCTSQLHYAAPQKTAHSAGTVSWSGSHCSDRFDFLQYRVVERAGTSPSPDPTVGTVVFTGTGTSYDSATSGNTYTVFADYNARAGSTVDGFSDPEVGSYVVVT